jgi:hypothetical protein
VRLSLRIALLAAFLLGAAPARAHDPFEMTLEARLESASIELVATMARATAEDLFWSSVPMAQRSRFAVDNATR